MSWNIKSSKEIEQSLCNNTFKYINLSHEND